MTQRCICALGQEPVVTTNTDGHLDIQWPNGRAAFTAVASELLDEFIANTNALTEANRELRRRHQTLLDALDIDRSTVIQKRAVRSIIKGR